MKLIITIIIACLTLFLLVVLNPSPYLRGPAEWPPEARYVYLPVLNVNRLWFPLLALLLILTLFNYSEKRKKTFLILIILVFLGMIWQLSVLYLRSGIFILIQRIIKPDLNGYFTASLGIEDLFNFLKNYEKIVLFLPMHAKGHPPGPVIFFWLINNLGKSLLPIFSGFLSRIEPAHNDIKEIWNLLLPYQKLGALLSAIIIPFLANLTIFPLFYLAKELYNEKVGLYTIFLYSFVPAIALFMPLSDVFFPVLPILAFLLLLKKQYFLSGLTSFLSLFFSLSNLPVIFLISLFHLFKQKKIEGNFLLFSRPAKRGKKTPSEPPELDSTSPWAGRMSFLLGIVILPFILLIFLKINFLSMVKTIISGQASRSYFLWLFYNLYEFFIFAGLPVSLLYLFSLKFLKKDLLSIVFLITLLLLDISGLSRAETGRIWLPLMPIMVLIVANFLVSIKFKLNFFLIILVLLAIETLILQSFWVTLW